MSPTIIHIPDDRGDDQERSQMESAAQPAETPSLRRSKNKRPDYKQCGNSDSESMSITDGASDGYMGFKGDIPAKKPSITKKGASRAARPQGGRQEPMSSEQQTPNRRVVIKSGKRSHDDHEIEPTRHAKRGRKPTANTEIKRFEKDTLELLEKSPSPSQSFESKFEQAQQAHKQSEISYSQQIAQLKNDAREWRFQLAHALDAAKKDSGKYVKVSDSEIKENWMTLLYNIRSLVSQYLTEKPSDQIEYLESLVLDHLLLSPDDLLTLRTNILRRAVWNILTLAVFSGSHSVWHGEIGATLTQFLSAKNDGHVDDPQYLEIISQIKCRAVADLDEKLHLDIRAMNALVDRATMNLGPFLPDSKVKRERFKCNIRRMIMKAAKLHSILMKSKAIFLVQWIGDDDGEELVRYDETKMASLQYGKDFDTSNSSIKFVEAPALVKIGNADGEQFDTSMVLCESLVMLEEDDDESSDGENGGKHES